MNASPSSRAGGQIHPYTRELIRRMVSRIVIPGLLVVIPTGIWVVWMAANYTGIQEAEGLHYAQLARNVARGQGLVTSVIPPLSLHFNESVVGHPELWHPPLYAWLEALAFRIFWPSLRVAAAVSGGCWIVLLGLTYRLGFRVFNRKVALAGVAFMLVNLTAQNLSISGRPHLLTGVLFTAFLLSLVSMKPEDAVGIDDRFFRGMRLRWLLASAALAGLIALASHDLAWPVFLAGGWFWIRWPARAGLNRPLVLPGSTLHFGDRSLAWLGQRIAPRLAILYSGTAFLVILPWLIRNAHVAGRPFFSLHGFTAMVGTSSFPAYSILRSYFPETPVAFALAVQHPLEMTGKVLGSLGRAPFELSTLLNPIIFATFVLACLLPAPATARPLRNLVLGLGLALVLFLSVFGQDFVSFIALAPAITLVSLGMLSYHLQPSPRETVSGSGGRRRRGMVSSPGGGLLPMRKGRRALLFAGLWLVATFPLLGHEPLRKQVAPFIPSSNVLFLAQHTPADAAVATVAPWLVAWYADVSCIWLPETGLDMDQIEQRMGPRIHWMYFARARADLPFDHVPGWWMTAGQSSEGYGMFRRHATLSREERLFIREES